MKKFLSSLKKKFSDSKDDLTHEMEEGYVELDINTRETGPTKYIVRPFVLDDFSDVRSVLDSLRGGKTIALINIKPLKDKDLVELKRAINKLKKTTDAISGEIAGFGDDWITVVPPDVKIYRKPDEKPPKEE